ncbi:hypothetical protein [Bradyrhizobium huanghuaihaiense]
MTTTGWPTTSTGTPTTPTDTATTRAGGEEFLAAGGREVVNLARELHAQTADDDRYTELREKLNKLTGLLENSRL